ncbi:hypothetical protein GCM10022247_61090 [Allokutzneria multivorans]|uniref:Uncharacterized protein n=2 Tax=Allokutzneria multivorans TaxID=1142134 RepID=A0ABP7TL48_9PSEU
MAAVALALTALTLPAAASPQTTKAEDCGYHYDVLNSWYTHCASSGNVKIEVDKVLGADEERCVPPGKSWLGMRKDVKGAKYTGQTC